jgi:GntR family transcriptional regulator/MocR family aminotransferase
MARSSTFPLDMILIDPQSDSPVYQQLYYSLRNSIMNGQLRADQRLPASRVLADDLRISRNTVIFAYEMLWAAGFLVTRRGSGTFVAHLHEQSAEVSEKINKDVLPPLSRRGRLMTAQPQEGSLFGPHTFHPGLPDLRQFPFAVWSKLGTANSRRINSEYLGYSMISGHPRLKEAISRYLAVSRGVNCEPDQVIVVGGAQAALDLISRLMIDPGDPVWMEEPGYDGARGALLSSGARITPILVDSSRWDFDPDAPPPRLIYVTPSCQWPNCNIMQMDDRLKLLELAAQHDSWIIEDDYDSEFRFRGPPIPALHGLDGADRVLYVGSFSKTIFPSLRIGFIVVPKIHVDDFTRAVNITGQHPSQLLQATLADFISNGHFSRHLRKMRRLYRRRKSLFGQLCREMLGDWMHLRSTDAGIQMVGYLKLDIDDGELFEMAKRRSIQFKRLSTLYNHTPPKQGMVLGYAANDDSQIRANLETLQVIFRDVESAKR